MSTGHFSRYTLFVSLLKSASTVSLWTLASRITGLVRELFIASTFGASALTDAFNVAFRIPNLFRRLFAEGAVSQAFVPVLAASKAQNGDEATKKSGRSCGDAFGLVTAAAEFCGRFGCAFLGLGHGQRTAAATRIV